VRTANGNVEAGCDESVLQRALSASVQQILAESKIGISSTCKIPRIVAYSVEDRMCRSGFPYVETDKYRLCAVPGSIPREYIQRPHRLFPFDSIAAHSPSRSPQGASLFKRLEPLDQSALYSKQVLIIRIISTFHILARYVS
jgi:hypothetical protein